MSKSKKIIRETLEKAKGIRGDAHRVTVTLYIADNRAYYEVEITNWENSLGGIGRGKTLRRAAGYALKDWHTVRGNRT